MGAKHDAFGREIGEDTLAGLRGAAPSSVEQPASAPNATTSASGFDDDFIPKAATATAPASSSGAPADVGTPVAMTWDLPAPERTEIPAVASIDVSRGPWWLLRFIPVFIVLAIMVPVGIGVYSAVDGGVDTARDAIDDVQRAIDEGRESLPTPGGGDDDGPVLGLQRGSLLTKSALSPALGRLQAHGKVRLIRLAPDRINAQLVRGDTLRHVSVAGAGAAAKVDSESPATGALETVPFASIDPAAPYRLTRSAAGRLRVPTTRVDYLVLMDLPLQGPSWMVYFKDGKGAFQGDAHGRVTRRIS
ncbi:hypothetical protein [Conexibacter sp. SYSU D00693]|uniref:hypothetical protein n=1 Tax=Conexibacter sp. SYSU D00693 TaxID=2812560 RepID=UPI00196B1192|nr:hypothetical protein [Conexibacter sp. SYSU D00693]